jgi:hypothetical protein
MPFTADGDSSSGDTEPLPSPTPGPGRDSSRLMQDIIEHAYADPQIHTSPPMFDPTVPHTTSEPTHLHAWVMKTRESVAQRPWNQESGEFSVTALCEKCQSHVFIAATMTADAPPKCGSGESDRPCHHFHIESWTVNARYSSSASAIEKKPELGVFRCCDCPLSLQIDFWLPVVPEYLLSTIKKRKTGTNSSLNPLNRSKDIWHPTNAFATMAHYVTDVLNGGTRSINITPESPFNRRVGADPDVLRFMEYLGWVKTPDGVLEPPQWDDTLCKGRLLRKRLEAAELELSAVAVNMGSLIPDSEKNRMLTLRYLH